MERGEKQAMHATRPNLGRPDLQVTAALENGQYNKPHGKAALVIAGMHRSGTSALARTLHVLGCDLPQTAAQPEPTNERSIGESAAIVALNNEILESAGSCWDDCEAFNPRWYRSPIAEAFKEAALEVLSTEFGATRLFLLNDPRICRLMPFWFEALDAFGTMPFVVCPIRNPLEVAASLEQRNGFDPLVGQLLWLRHVLDAEVASRGRRRAFIRYEDLLEDWYGTVDRLSKQLEVSWPRAAGVDVEIEAFLAPELRQHVRRDGSVLKNSRLSKWIRSSFEILNRWAQDGMRHEDQAELDRIRSALNDAGPVFGRAGASKWPLRKDSSDSSTVGTSGSSKTLGEIIAEHRGKAADTWSSYISRYESVLSRYRNKPINMLEIGVDNGGSLEIWSKYFYNAQNIVGCDINPDCALLEYDDPRITLVLSDASSDMAQRAILERSPSYDVIIDDGSHRSSDIIRSFARYFPHLSNGGVYIVEDMHCSYWDSFEGGLYNPFSSMGFFKRLIDIINYEHWGVDKAPEDLLSSICSTYECHIERRDIRSIKSIEFDNSLCIIRKESAKNCVLGMRVVKGTEAVVTREALSFDGAMIRRRSQASNKWATRALAPEEELPIRMAELADLSARVEALKTRDGEAKELASALGAEQARASELSAKLEASESELRILRKRSEVEHKRAGELSARAHALEADISGLKAALNQRNAEADRLKAALHASKHELQQLTTSASWRITAPLRQVKRSLERVARLPARGLKLPRRIKLQRRLRREVALIADSGLFDHDQYRSRNPDVTESGIDPIVHYLLYGAAEGRNPSSKFDTKWYLRQNRDVLDAKMNPLVHFIRFGMAEGRQPVVQQEQPRKSIDGHTAGREMDPVAVQRLEAHGPDATKRSSTRPATKNESHATAPIRSGAPSAPSRNQASDSPCINTVAAAAVHTKQSSSNSRFLRRDERLLHYDLSPTIVQANSDLMERFQLCPELTLHRAAWFLPAFDHVYRGGIYTILRVAQHFSRSLGTLNILVIYDPTGRGIKDELQFSISNAFPGLRFEIRSLSNFDDVQALPDSDAAFCTLWTTAYALVRYQRCQCKFYFIQDFEPAFEAAGSISGLIEQTYRFGFMGIANTPGVGDIYRQYNPWTEFFVPGIDHSVFYPDRGRLERSEIKRIVFYGRPRNARNAFLLGIEALRIVKEALGDQVEIISAGADFSVSDYGLDGILENRGVLKSLEEVAALYRSADVGLVFMFTAHPSYQPFEFMASGCATVSNVNRYTGWFLRDEHNAMLPVSTPSCVADSIIRLIADKDLHRSIVEGGLATVAELNWEAALDRITNFVCRPSPANRPLALSTLGGSSATLPAPVQTDSAAEGFTHRCATEDLVPQSKAAAQARDWAAAEAIWAEVQESAGDNTWLRGEAKLNISLARRLADVAGYQEQIRRYRAAQCSGAEDAGHLRIAVYTAITGEYDFLKLPERLDSRFDYILFTDKPVPDTGIFKVMPLSYLDADHGRSARFVKTHPHVLLRDYDVAIWLDAHIMILGDIYPLVENFLLSGKAVAAVPHPFRTSVYEEHKVLLERQMDDSDAMREQVARYHAAGFVHDDLIESGFMMFRPTVQQVGRFLDAWWREIDRYSKRDQLSLNYALREAEIDWHRLTERPNSIRNHPSFALVRHNVDGTLAQELVRAVQTSVVDPYDAPSYASVRIERIAAQMQRRIDIVLCVHDALDQVRNCVQSIECNRTGENQRLIIVDDGSSHDTAEFLSRFSCERAWVDLYRNEQAIGYTKAANRGLVESSGELVILLNSDTVVTDGWAEKMADAVFSTAGAGIVGVMSNAAGQQSIPENRGKQGQTAINALPYSVTADDMNRYCEEWSATGIVPRVPLVHGFCFGFTRAVIEKVGVFDEANFPRGYGEENDYCFRAMDAGFGLIVAPHTFIFHEKSKSFVESERLALMKQGRATLEAIHGPARVARAVRSMQVNPILANLRARAASLDEEKQTSASHNSRRGDLALSPGQFVRYVRENGFDFIDFGCSHGGSLKQGIVRFNARKGLGIDICPKKVESAIANGYDAILFNIEDIPDRRLVRFTTLSHFLEHVPDMEKVREFIRKGCAISEEFVFVKQPFFDADGYLFRHGLKCFWSDWTGHPNRMSTLELALIGRDLKRSGLINSYLVYAKGAIKDSSDRRIHPLESPIDQHEYDPDKHPPKRVDVIFKEPVFYEAVAVFMTGALSPDDVARKYRPEILLHCG